MKASILTLAGIPRKRDEWPSRCIQEYSLGRSSLNLFPGKKCRYSTDDRQNAANDDKDPIQNPLLETYVLPKEFKIEAERHNYADGEAQR